MAGKFYKHSGFSSTIIETFISHEMDPVDIAWESGGSLSLSISVYDFINLSEFLPRSESENNLCVVRYLDLITSQYRLSTKFLSWLRRPLEMICDMEALLKKMPSHFDLDEAIGKQEDIIGELLGQGRNLGFDPSDGSTPILSDAFYRSLLKYRVGMNKWDGQIHTLYELWKSLFPDVQIDFIDNQDMSCDINFVGYLPQVIKDMIKEDLLLPRPEGVRYRFFGEEDFYPYFSYDMFDEQFKGYDYGYWDLVV